MTESVLKNIDRKYVVKHDIESNQKNYHYL